MDNYQHLLSKHGILVTFNIAKKIKPSEIKSIRKKLESKFPDVNKLEKAINKEIKAKTKTFLQENDIPGLIQKGGETFDKIYINKKIQTKILSLAKKVVEYCKQHNFTVSSIDYTDFLRFNQTFDISTPNQKHES